MFPFTILGLPYFDPYPCGLFRLFCRRLHFTEVEGGSKSDWTIDEVLVHLKTPEKETLCGSWMRSKA